MHQRVPVPINANKREKQKILTKTSFQWNYNSIYFQYKNVQKRSINKMNRIETVHNNRVSIYRCQSIANHAARKLWIKITNVEEFRSCFTEAH